jgi:hypothetical protein
MHKNEAGGGRTRAMDLQALVSQQSTMTNTITSLLQQVQLLKNSLRLADDSDEVQELENELQDVNTSRKELRAQLRDLDEDIRKETIVVARERNEVVEQEEQEQMKRRARDAKAARVLRLSPRPHRHRLQPTLYLQITEMLCTRFAALLMVTPLHHAL